MAGDARVPRLLIPRSVRAALALVAVMTGGCDAPWSSARRPERTPSVDARVASASRSPRPPADGRTAAMSVDDGGPVADPVDDADLARTAWARLRWPGGEVLESQRLERLEEPVYAGSLFKLLVARAAVEQGVVTPDTRMACPRRLETHGRRVDCVHPDLGRPLALDDALAHSCNHFFVRIADRLDRARLTATIRRLTDGRVTTLTEAPLPLVVLGLQGPQLGLLTWTRAALHALGGDGVASRHLLLLRRGAVGAASHGTAGALRDATILTYAKTGTTVPVDGAQDGRVMAWRPELEEAVVVRAAGVPGREAARVARAVWDRALTRGDDVVRVGRVREATEPAAGVDTIALEAYVSGVVGAEGEAAMPAVALHALAIAARSYARAPDGRHVRDGFDVCDTTHCQVFGDATPWSRAAALATRGLTFTRNGRVVAVPYSASCGGVLLSSRLLWGGHEPDLALAGPEPAPHEVPSWVSDVPADRLITVLRAAGHGGDVLRDVRVASSTRDGVPTTVALVGLAPPTRDATSFRHLVGRALGWQVLKSHDWRVSRTATGFRFAGRGKGHGVGLCLRGASVIAGRGGSLAQVTGAYLRGVTLRPPPGAFTLRLPPSMAGEASRLRREALATYLDVVAQLGGSSPRQVEIVVHPTREAYQRATGRAWWTTGTTRRTAPGVYRIDVPGGAGPLLLATSLLRTLAHEFAHVLTASTLADAPSWTSEGLATLVARAAEGRPGLVRDAPGACPSDAELLAPGGAESMRAAYVRAAACVTRALPDGLGGWRALAIEPQ